MVNEMTLLEVLLDVVAVFGVLAVYGSHLKGIKKPPALQLEACSDLLGEIDDAVSNDNAAAIVAVSSAPVQVSTENVNNVQHAVVPFIRRARVVVDAIAVVVDEVRALPALEFYKRKNGVEGLRSICRKYGINPRPYIRGKRRHLSNEAMIAQLFAIGVKVAIA